MFSALELLDPANQTISCHRTSAPGSSALPPWPQERPDSKDSSELCTINLSQSSYTIDENYAQNEKLCVARSTQFDILQPARNLNESPVLSLNGLLMRIATESKSSEERRATFLSSNGGAENQSSLGHTFQP